MATSILIEGFETGRLNASGNGVVQGTTKRTGDYAMQMSVSPDSGPQQQIFAYDPTAGGDIKLYNEPTCYYRFYAYFATLPGGAENFFNVRNALSAYKFKLAINGSGNLSAYGNSGLLASGSASLSTATWYRIEVIVGTDTDAPYEVKVDGVVDITGTSSDLTGLNNAVMIFGRPIALDSSLSYELYVDDIRVDNDGYPGAGQIKRLDVSAVGANNEWLSSLGGAAVVNDVDAIPFTFSEYCTSNLTNGVAQTWTFESCASAGISGTIGAVQFHTLVADSLGTSSVFLRLKQSGYSAVDTSAGANVTTTGTMLGWTKALDLGDDPWTIAAVDTFEGGTVSGTGSVNHFCSSIAAQIDFLADTGVLHRPLPGRPG